MASSGVINCVVIGSKNGQKAEISITASDTIDCLKAKVEGKFRVPKSTIRLLFSGRELKPMTAKVGSFNIGKYGNFIIHMSTTTIELEGDDSSSAAPPQIRNFKRSSPHLVELVDLTDSAPSVTYFPRRQRQSWIPIDLESDSTPASPIVLESFDDNNMPNKRQSRKRRLERSPTSRDGGDPVTLERRRNGYSCPLEVLDLSGSEVSATASASSVDVSLSAPSTSSTPSAAMSMPSSQLPTSMSIPPPATRVSDTPQPSPPPSSSSSSVTGAVASGPSALSSSTSGGPSGGSGVYPVGKEGLAKATRLRLARALNHRLYLLHHTFQKQAVVDPTGVGSVTVDVLKCVVQEGGDSDDRHRVEIGQTCHCDCGDEYLPYQHQAATNGGSSSGSGVSGSSGVSVPAGRMLCKHVIFVLVKVLRVSLTCPLIQSGHVSPDQLKLIFRSSGFLPPPAGDIVSGAGPSTVPGTQLVNEHVSASPSIGGSSSGGFKMDRATSESSVSSSSRESVGLHSTIFSLQEPMTNSSSGMNGNGHGRVGAVEESDGLDAVGSSAHAMAPPVVPRRRAIVIDLGDSSSDNEENPSAPRGNAQTAASAASSSTSTSLLKDNGSSSSSRETKAKGTHTSSGASNVAAAVLLMASKVDAEQAGAVALIRAQEEKERIAKAQEEAAKALALECPVCFDSIETCPEAVVSCKQCKNALHRDCLQQWQKTSKTCPFCRHKWPSLPPPRKKSSPKPAVATRSATRGRGRGSRGGRGRGAAVAARGLRNL